MRRSIVKNLQNVGENILQSQRRTLYEQTRSGNLTFERKKIEMQRQISEIERMKRNAQRLKTNAKWTWTEFRDRILQGMTADNKSIGFEDQELVKFWDFNQHNNGVISSYPMKFKNDNLNDLNNWYVTCDSDFDIGYSSASLDISPSGYALFSGYLDTTLPKDGKVDRTGYAYFGCHKNQRQKIFDQQTSEMEPFTHICLRVRGDGRKYHIVFDTSTAMDITWFDRFQFMLFTHGGPYWQEVKIPLSKFFFHYQGFVQDEQHTLNPDDIKSVGILATDNFNGPFRLEIDYIGFMSDSQWNDRIDYEGYYHEQTVLKNIGSV